MGEILIERGLINRDKLNAALQEQGVTGARLGKILVRNGFLRQKKLLEILHEVSPESMHEESVFLPSIPAELPDEEAVAKVLSNERSWKTIVEDAPDKLGAGVTDKKEIHRVFGAEFDDLAMTSLLRPKTREFSNCSV